MFIYARTPILHLYKQIYNCTKIKIASGASQYLAERVKGCRLLFMSKMH